MVPEEIVSKGLANVWRYKEAILIWNDETVRFNLGVDFFFFIAWTKELDLNYLNIKKACLELKCPKAFILSEGRNVLLDLDFFKK